MSAPLRGDRLIATDPPSSRSNATVREAVAAPDPPHGCPAHVLGRGSYVSMERTLGAKCPARVHVDDACGRAASILVHKCRVCGRVSRACGRVRRACGRADRTCGRVRRACGPKCRTFGRLVFGFVSNWRPNAAIARTSARGEGVGRPNLPASAAIPAGSSAHAPSPLRTPCASPSPPGLAGSLRQAQGAASEALTSEG
jgi:hypothetical protein